MILHVFTWLTLFLAFLAWDAMAYPELAGGKYVSCRACHTTHQGGSRLTEYGRGFAQGMTWFEGPTPLTPVLGPLTVGLEARAVQTYLETSTVIVKRFIPMQAEVQPELTLGKFHAEASIGATNETVREAWASFESGAFWVRAGRWNRTRGLRHPNHLLSLQSFESSNQGEIGVHNRLGFIYASTLSSGVVGFVHGHRVGFDFVYDSGVVWHGTHQLQPLSLLWSFDQSGSYTAGLSFAPARGLVVTGLVDSGRLGFSLRAFPVTHTEIEAGVLGNQFYVMGHLWL